MNRFYHPTFIFFALAIVLISCSTYVWDTLNKKANSFSVVTTQEKAILIPNAKSAHIVHFWAFNHPLSRQSLAYMNELQTKAQKRGVQLTLICLNWTGSEYEINDYLAKNNYTFDVVFDKDAKIAQFFEVTSIPQTQIIQSNSIITHRLMGLREDIDYVDEILAKAN